MPDLHTQFIVSQSGNTSHFVVIDPGIATAESLSVFTPEIELQILGRHLLSSGAPVAPLTTLDSARGRDNRFSPGKKRNGQTVLCAQQSTGRESTDRAGRLVKTV